MVRIAVLSLASAVLTGAGTPTMAACLQREGQDIGQFAILSETLVPMVVPGEDPWEVREERVEKLPRGAYQVTAHVRIVGRRARILADTERRGMPVTFTVKVRPATLLEFAAYRLPVRCKRVVSDPERGEVLWLTVLKAERLVSSD